MTLTDQNLRLFLNEGMGNISEWGQLENSGITLTGIFDEKKDKIYR